MPSGTTKPANCAMCPGRLPWKTVKSKRSRAYRDTLVAQAAMNTVTAFGAYV